jgi:hypothetical protein
MVAKKKPVKLSPPKREKLPPTNYEAIQQLITSTGLPPQKVEDVMAHLDQNYDVIHQERVQNVANRLLEWLSANVSPTHGRLPATTTELQMALLLVQLKVSDMSKSHETSRVMDQINKVLQEAGGREPDHDDGKPDENYKPSKAVPSDVASIYA